MEGDREREREEDAMMYGGTRKNRWDELDMRRLLAGGGEEGWCRRKWML